MPGKKHTGTNTAKSTNVVAMIGRVTCPIALSVASRGARLSATMMRWTFSIITMESSTTSVIARMIANRVIMLAEKPMPKSTAIVPMSATGIAIAGISVVRQLARKMNVTATTRAPVIKSVLMISSTEARTALVMS